MRLKNRRFSFGALLVWCATGLSSIHGKNPCGCVSRLPCPIQPAECDACVFLAYAVCEVVTTLSSVFLCPFVARARATCSIAFQGLCLKPIKPSKVGDSKTSECTYGQEHGPPIFSCFTTDRQITEEGAHGYYHSESSVCWATMQWRGEKENLISIKIRAHFGTVRC
jgi:hypothetical protein